MIDASAPLPTTLLTSLPLSAEALALPVAEGADPQSTPKGADFSAILAALPVQTASPTANAEPARLPLAALPIGEEATMATAPALPVCGKILPPALPHPQTTALADEPDSTEPDAEGMAETQPPLDSVTPDAQPADHPQMAPVPVTQATSIALPAPPSAEWYDAASVALPPAPVDERARQPAAMAAPLVALAARPMPAPPKTDTMPGELAMMPETAPEPSRSLVERPAAIVLLPEPPKAPVSPFAVLALRPVSDRNASDREATALALPSAVGTALTPPAVNAALLPAPPVTAPHDFAALVDRLVAAREAVQPQAVSVALKHADFGPVRIDFRHEDGTLSVALASPDPDFARAMAAAPAVPVAAPADTGQSQSRSADPRQPDAGSHSPRGQSHGERRDERAPQTNRPAQRQVSKDSQSRSGIFA